MGSPESVARPRRPRAGLWRAGPAGAAGPGRTRALPGAGEPRARPLFERAVWAAPLCAGVGCALLLAVRAVEMRTVAKRPARVGSRAVSLSLSSLSLSLSSLSLSLSFTLSLKKAPFINLEMDEMGITMVLGRAFPDLKLCLPFKRHICIELSYLDPRNVRRVRPFPGVSHTIEFFFSNVLLLFSNPLPTFLQTPYKFSLIPKP